MSEKYFDFDAAMEERKGSKFVVKAFGEKYELPGEIPFEIVLTIARKHKNNEKEMSEQDMIDLSIVLFGEETFNSWLQKGITISGVIVMMEGVMAMYMDQAANTSRQMANNKSENVNP